MLDHLEEVVCFTITESLAVIYIVVISMTATFDIQLMIYTTI